MFPVILQKLRQFLRLGIRPGMLEPEQRRVWLLNAFYLIGTFAFIASSIAVFVIDGVAEGAAMFGFGLAFLPGLLFLARGKTRAGEFYLILVANLALLFFENRHGSQAGFYLYYFPLMVLAAFLVDFRHSRFTFTGIYLVLVSIVTGILLRYRFLYREFPAGDNEVLFLYNLLFSGILTAVISLVIIRQSYRQYNDFRARMAERKQAEESMKAAIREKETLLAEVHHRVKNNLSVISSLLNLQLNTVTNEYTRDVLRESRNRVRSMALIHQKLYDTPNVEEIDFGQYAQGLVEEIRHSYIESVAENVEVTITAAHYPLSLTVAVPCGLVLNEVLSNCYKHAFPGGRSGRITIRFDRQPGVPNGFYLEVEDNGVGLPGNFDAGQTSSLGMTIIQSLAEQIDATWELSRREAGGTYFRMKFRAG